MSVDRLARDLAGAVRGEVRFDRGSRALYAHDASNYRQVPLGVVTPRDARDVEQTVAVCREHGAPVLGRGGGTSLAGQCVNVAVVIDFSRHMTRVLEVDPARRRVRVEPGCTLDDMRAALKPHGLTFGPDPATHDHCTLGGMLGNNSCGVHSVLGEFHGPGARTSDHVEELEVLTYDGLRMRVGATPEAELAAIAHEDGRRGAIYRTLRDIRDRNADRIRRRFAPIPRRVSGYNLDELLPENGFQVARALVGSESTCVTILEATFAVYPDLPARVLCLLGYPGIAEAGDQVPRIRQFRPVGLEGMDDLLLDFMKRSGLHARDFDLFPPGRGWLLVELGGDTAVEATARARQLLDALAGEPGRPEMKLCTPDEAAAIWRIREAGLGATAFVPGQGDAWPGWEDSAVPPERVGPYLRELRALLDRHGLTSSLYGHFGQGCVHTAIDFDLASPDGRARYRRFTDEAADLCVRHGGSLSGEHGDGQARSELLVKQFGPELVAAFRDFKRAWDPGDRMNPGKVVEGPGRTSHLKLAVYRPREPDTMFHFGADGGSFRHAAIRCVGIGECRRTDTGVMCPSYMVTRDEKHTTRGRAHLLFEMMQGEVITDGWASEEVKESLDLCLACKGCKGECPVKVDMATYKAEFLHHYHQHHPRPRQAYAFGWIHRWARLGGEMPLLANLVTQAPGLRWLAARAAGMAPERSIPRFAAVPFSRQVAPPRAGTRGPVVLWPDTFNNHFIPRTLVAARAVLEEAGYQVLVPRAPVCCGRALYDYGMLPLARRMWQRTRRVLGRHIERGTPVVGIEPSCVAAFRDELPALFAGEEWAARLGAQAMTLSELLVKGGYDPPRVDARALVHPHCHHAAVLGFDAERALLESLGLDIAMPDAGCCGLAGSFGYEADHYRVSMQIGERRLLPAVRAAGDRLVIADGFSCRQQIEHGTGRRAHHVAEVVAAALVANRRLVRRDQAAASRASAPRRSDSPWPGRERSMTR